MHILSLKGHIYKRTYIYISGWVGDKENYPVIVVIALFIAIC